jgi:hypothetical protein
MAIFVARLFEVRYVDQVLRAARCHRGRYKVLKANERDDLVAEVSL